MKNSSKKLCRKHIWAILDHFPLFFQKNQNFLGYEQKVGATLAGFEIIISHWPLTDCEPILSGL